MDKCRPRKEQTTGEPSRLLFLLLVAGQERDVAEAFETRESVVEDDVADLVGDVAVAPGLRHQRIEDDRVATGELERAGEERVVLDTLELLELSDVDESVRRVNDATHVPGERRSVHAIARREAHCFPDVRREALGLSFESTAKSQL